MFCTIKHTDPQGQERQFYVNLDCAIKFILNYIREEIKFEGEFDLCDLNGVLKYVNEYEPQERGDNILKELETYMIVSIERNEDGSFMKLIPLLADHNPKKAEFELKLKRYINPSKRFTYDLKKSRSGRTSGKSVENKKPK